MKSNPKFFVGEGLSTTKHKGPVHNVSPAGAEIYFEKGKRPYNKMNTHTMPLHVLLLSVQLHTQYVRLG